MKSDERIAATYRIFSLHQAMMIASLSPLATFKDGGYHGRPLLRMMTVDNQGQWHTIQTFFNIFPLQLNSRTPPLGLLVLNLARGHYP